MITKVTLKCDLDGIIRHLQEMELRMNETLARLLTEVEETKGQNASILAFAAGVPGLIRQAVADALAANPGLTDEDLAAITQAADDLDAGQQAIAAAIGANSAPVTPPVEE